MKHIELKTVTEIGNLVREERKRQNVYDDSKRTFEEKQIRKICQAKWQASEELENPPFRYRARRRTHF